MTPAGFWLAYHTDGSMMVPFVQEIDALRYAVANVMQVQFVKWGAEISVKMH